MNILFIMIPLSLLLATSFLIAFIWNVKSGQIDDVETPPQRMLEDEQGD